MRRRRLIRNSGRRLRPVEWLGAFSNYNLVASDDDTLYDLTGSLVQFNQFTQPTLMRMRGRMQVSLPGTVPAETIGAVGIIAQIPDAITTIPVDISPTSQQQLEWIWWHPYFLRSDGSAADGDGRSIAEYEIDSKAMRKLYNGEQLFLWIRSSMSAVNFAFSLRMLFKE